ncbi:MAG: hypothetical protein MHM6MM_004776 [Cercozoa sp. M6MM]
MVLVGALLAYSTRQVNIEALNDSRQMYDDLLHASAGWDSTSYVFCSGVAIYLVSTGFVLVAIAGYVVDAARMNARFSIVAFAGLSVVGASMAIIFAPKLLAVRRGDDWTKKSLIVDNPSDTADASSATTA